MSTGGCMETFLAANDELGYLINNKANHLFDILKSFDEPVLDVSNTYNDYFIHHHLGPRLFFSIQNSAHILYEAIKLSGKPLKKICAIDYGAGLGTLFMLGGMLGFKRFDYNDHLPEWQSTAKAVCKKSGIIIDDYITGDINAVVNYAALNNISYDIVVSRNVIEHIYNLQEFYRVIFNHNPKTIVYSTTTANYHNLAMRWYHIYIHKKVDRLYYKPQRAEEIRKINPSLPADQVTELTALTRGTGQQDFVNAVNNFAHSKALITDSSLRTNVCDCITGVWSEHLLTKNEYQKIINGSGFKMMYKAGYWDTHYSSGIKNFFAAALNRLIKISGERKGITLSPFVNIIAYN
jgi:2-polyprenyl-3-methyl-5-hydroxy-6-metoxy-1,4-benzoquinol methylase